MTFVRNHAKAIVASDFFVVVTAHPTAEWTLQQFREALPGDHPYRFVIHDRDNIFSRDLDKGVTAMGVRVLRPPVRAAKAFRPVTPSEPQQFSADSIMNTRLRRWRHEPRMEFLRSTANKRARKSVEGKDLAQFAPDIAATLWLAGRPVMMLTSGPGFGFLILDESETPTHSILYCRRS